MRLIILTFVVWACAAGPGSTAESERLNDVRSRPKPVAKVKRAFPPFGLIRRMSKAESEFAFRLSSWGIRSEAEAGPSHASPPPVPLAETSTSMLQGPAGGASQ